MSFQSNTDFEVHLDNFSGPFDLLLTLIYKRRLDVTHLALAQVTDEFLAYLPKIKSFSEASEFLVIAATLLNLKAARLLPKYEDDDDTVTILEEADLLFSRLLRYRAFKIAAQSFAGLFESSIGRYPRQAPLPDELIRALPPLKSPLDARILVQAMHAAAEVEPDVATDHVHQIQVSVRSQERYLYGLLRNGRASFADIIRESESVVFVIARFLAALNLYRDGVITLTQSGPETPIILELRIAETMPSGGEEDEL